MAEKEIQKPWAVYKNLSFQYRIGRIKRDSGSFYWIKFKEDEDSELWDKRYVRTFDDPLKAIAYLLVITGGRHMNHKRLFHKTERKDIIQSLFIQFPSERKNIESLLAQTSPKFTSNPKDYIEQHCCPHEFLKNPTYADLDRIMNQTLKSIKGK